MSIRIQKQGLMDTLQDIGRYGYQHLGINPGGAMDTVAMRVGNALVGNDPGEAVLEMHFPAAGILFEETGLVALTGADFGAMINGQPVPMLQPLVVSKGAVLTFDRQVAGARLYFSMQGGFDIQEWMGSGSTNLKAKAGGFKGRSLQKNDHISCKKRSQYFLLPGGQPWKALPWKANVAELYQKNRFHFIPGAEFGWLTYNSQSRLTSCLFTIDRQSDRMACRLQGEPLISGIEKELISTAVTEGTIQLLPGGQLIILLADHQTTGGYPRIGHLSGASIPSLAQLQPGEKFSLHITDMTTAEAGLMDQEQKLQQIRHACHFRIQQYGNISPGIL